MCISFSNIQLESKQQRKQYNEHRYFQIEKDFD